MSSTVKGMLIRTAPEVYRQRLFKGKYVDQFDLARQENPSFHGLNWPGRVGHSRHSRQSMHIVNGITNPNPNKYEPGHNKAKAILSPVVDSTTPTTKKVLILCSLVLTWYYNDM